MSKSPFTILTFTPENLAKALSNKLTSSTEVKKKIHFGYFNHYLGGSDGLNAQTILIEEEYISKSYLQDYSNYYSTCFSPYDRVCKRVHFFKDKFGKGEFSTLLRDPKCKFKKIWDSYLGHIVVKPLPKVLIGATVLKTYETSASNRRLFPTTKTYQVNLFGKNLELESLAFQEQDSVVGACASSALWSAFHKTSQLFQTPLPSPSDITRSAKNLFHSSGRTYPNEGLDHYQIGSAIEFVGLVSELRNKKSFAKTTYLKSFIYSYCRIGLPVLLGIQFDNGGHLIAITGYRDENKVNFKRDDKISLRADSIEKFYAHDDQVGPFARIKIDHDGNVETTWDDVTGKETIRKATFSSLFIPLHHKIRLKFEDIYTKVRFFDFYMSKKIPDFDIYWDIYLDFSNNYKNEAYNSPHLNQKQRVSITTAPLPKYIWIAKGFVNNVCVIEFLFDATQIHSADFCIRINIYNQSLATFLREDIKNTDIVTFFQTYLSDEYLEKLKNDF